MTWQHQYIVSGFPYSKALKGSYIYFKQTCTLAMTQRLCTRLTDLYNTDIPGILLPA